MQSGNHEKKLHQVATMYNMYDREGGGKTNKQTTNALEQWSRISQKMGAERFPFFLLKPSSVLRSGNTALFPTTQLILSE